MLVPNFDISCNDVNYTFQDLLKLSEKPLISSDKSSSSSSLYLSTTGGSLSSDNFKSINQPTENNFSFDDSMINSSEFISTLNPPSSYNLDSIQPPIALDSTNPSSNNNLLSTQPSSSFNSIPITLASSTNNFNSNAPLSPLVSSNLNNFQSLNPIAQLKQEHLMNRMIHKLFNFASASREVNGKDSREWRDSFLAILLIDAMIPRAQMIISVKEKHL